MCEQERAVPDTAIRAATVAFVRHGDRMDPTSGAAYGSWRAALEAAAPFLPCQDPEVPALRQQLADAVELAGNRGRERDRLRDDLDTASKTVASTWLDWRAALEELDAVRARQSGQGDVSRELHELKTTVCDLVHLARDDAHLASGVRALACDLVLSQDKGRCMDCSKHDYPCPTHTELCDICDNPLNFGLSSVTETEDGWVHAQCYTEYVVGRQQAASKED